MDEWINKSWYILTVKYYSALKTKEIGTHATTWMNLEDIMLSETSQTQKDKYYRFHFYEVPRAVKFIKTESRMQVTKDWGEGEMGVIVSWIQSFCLGWWKISGIDHVDGCTTLWIYLMPLNCPLKMVQMVNPMLCIFYYNKKALREKCFTWRNGNVMLPECLSVMSPGQL